MVENKTSNAKYPSPKTNCAIYACRMNRTRQSCWIIVSDKVPPLPFMLFCRTDGWVVDQEVVAKLAEVDMTVADLERANSRVATLERRNVSPPSSLPSLPNSNTPPLGNPPRRNRIPPHRHRNFHPRQRPRIPDHRARVRVGQALQSVGGAEGSDGGVGGGRGAEGWGV